METNYSINPIFAPIGATGHLVQIITRKMQLIYQNNQQENFHLLVPFVKLFGQIKLLLFNKNRNGRINVEFGKSLT